MFDRSACRSFCYSPRFTFRLGVRQSLNAVGMPNLARENQRASRAARRCRRRVVSRGRQPGKISAQAPPVTARVPRQLAPSARNRSRSAIYGISQARGTIRAGRRRESQTCDRPASVTGGKQRTAALSCESWHRRCHGFSSADRACRAAAWLRGGSAHVPLVPFQQLA